MDFSACLYILAIFCISHEVAVADQIISTSGGGTFGRNSREPKYRIEFHSKEFPYQPDDNQESVSLSNVKGQKFLCFLPSIAEHKTAESTLQLNSSNMAIESNLRRSKLKTPDELMEVMKDRCFVRHEGWWSYEFCHLKIFRQFHLGDDNKIVQEFILGGYDPEATAALNDNQSAVAMLKDPRSKDASRRYHAHRYTNGTMCDITNQPRETEVRFICAESMVMISSIKEVSTCKYAVVIHCPMLCRHPLFQEERSVWHTINCNEKPIEEENKDPKRRQSFEGEKQLIMVADIEGAADSHQYAT